MFPLKCKTCSKTVFSPGINAVPPICDHPNCSTRSLLQLAKICCLIPLKEGGNLILTSEEMKEKTPGGTIAKPGSQWQTACNSKFLPMNYSPVPSATTCFHCLEYLKSNDMLQPKVESEDSFLEDTEIVFEEDLPNPFQAPTPVN